MTNTQRISANHWMALHEAIARAHGNKLWEIVDGMLTLEVQLPKDTNFHKRENLWECVIRMGGTKSTEGNAAILAPEMRK